MRQDHAMLTDDEEAEESTDVGIMRYREMSNTYSSHSFIDRGAGNPVIHASISFRKLTVVVREV
jgi:hypothetical protein